MEKIVGNYVGELPEESALSETDSRLLEIVKGFRNRIKIVGIGGSGCNTLSRLSTFDIPETELVAMNTDAQALLHTVADKKVILGRNSCRGLGAGGYPDRGETSMRESLEDAMASMKGAKIVFITTGLGGGTGTGAAPILARAAKDSGAVCVSVVTLPFRSEGHHRWQNAVHGLKKLNEVADAIIVIPNNKLLELVPSLPLNSAFTSADKYLGDTLRGAIELIYEPGVVNRDLADLSSMFRNAGVAVMGVGESTLRDEQERVEEAVDLAMRSPLLDADISTANRVLVNISGGRSMKLDNVKDALSTITGQLAPHPDLFWGVQVDERLDAGKIRVMVIVCGVTQCGDIVIGTTKALRQMDVCRLSVEIKPVEVLEDERGDITHSLGVPY